MNRFKNYAVVKTTSDVLKYYTLYCILSQVLQVLMCTFEVYLKNSIPMKFPILSTCHVLLWCRSCDQ